MGEAKNGKHLTCERRWIFQDTHYLRDYEKYWQYTQVPVPKFHEMSQQKQFFVHGLTKKKSENKHFIAACMSILRSMPQVRKYITINNECSWFSSMNLHDINEWIKYGLKSATEYDQDDFIWSVSCCNDLLEENQNNIIDSIARDNHYTNAKIIKNVCDNFSILGVLKASICGALPVHDNHGEDKKFVYSVAPSPNQKTKFFTLIVWYHDDGMGSIKIDSLKSICSFVNNNSIDTVINLVFIARSEAKNANMSAIKSMFPNINIYFLLKSSVIWDWYASSIIPVSSILKLKSCNHFNTGHEHSCFHDNVLNSIDYDQIKSISDILDLRLESHKHWFSLCPLCIYNVINSCAMLACFESEMSLYISDKKRNYIELMNIDYQSKVYNLSCVKLNQEAVQTWIRFNEGDVIDSSRSFGKRFMHVVRNYASFSSANVDETDDHNNTINDSPNQEE